MQDAPQEEPLLSFSINQQADTSPSLPADDSQTPSNQEETQAAILQQKKQETASQQDTPLSIAEEAQTLVEQPITETSQPQIASSEQLVLPENLTNASDSESLAVEEATELLANDSASDKTSSADDALSADQQAVVEDASALAVTPDTNEVDALAQLAPQPQAPRRKRLKRRTGIALCVVLLLLLGSGAVLFDLEYYQPYQAQATANAQATGTAATALTQTASFDATSIASDQATAEVYQNIYQKATYGTPFLTDPLSKQSSANWDNYTDPGQDACIFKDGSYHVQQLQTGYFMPCDEQNNGYEDFTLQVNMTIVSGDYGGIIFRGKDGFFYFVEIDLSGDYALYKWDYQQSSGSSIRLSSGSTGYMLPGNNQVNQLTLIVEGSTFYLYVNQHYINTFTDRSFASGWIGFVADNDGDSTDVAFSNEKLWLL